MENKVLHRAQSKGEMENVEERYQRIVFKF